MTLHEKTFAKKIALGVDLILKYIGMIVSFFTIILFGGVIFYVSTEFYHVAERRIYA